MEPRREKVVAGDGAEWIRNLAYQHFPDAIQIVEIFHARQHLWDIARALHPLDPNSPTTMDSPSSTQT